MNESRLRLRLLVGGSHLMKERGYTVREIEKDGFPIAEKIRLPYGKEEALDIAATIGAGVVAFAKIFARKRPDILLLLGDRHEMLAAAAAALPFAIPIAHIHGGESTEGLIDEAIRHSITKMSHIHFPAVPAYGKRIERMGEEPWRITVCGAPALDNLKEIPLMDKTELRTRLRGFTDDPFLLATFHPVTLESQKTDRQLDELFHALKITRLKVLFTAPGADTKGRRILAKILELTKQDANFRLEENLGTRVYFSLMKSAAAMVGNSSSGIIEAASFLLPVVNIGDRQRGRMHGLNVIDVPCERKAIVAAVRKAISAPFRAKIRELRNIYDAGGATKKIVHRLATIAINDTLIKKRFHESNR